MNSCWFQSGKALKEPVQLCEDGIGNKPTDCTCLQHGAPQASQHMEICCYTQKHGQRRTQTHTHEGGINIKTGTWREFCLLLSVACQCSLIISYALSSVGIHIWAINSNLTVSVSPTHMHRHIVGVFVWPSAEGGNRSRFLDFCNFILRDCALSTELVQPQWQKGPTPVFMCVCVCVCVCMWC